MNIQYRLRVKEISMKSKVVIREIGESRLAGIASPAKSVLRKSASGVARNGFIGKPLARERLSGEMVHPTRMVSVTHTIQGK